MSVATAAPVIRPMRRGDVRAVRRIDTAAYGSAWSRETWAAEIGDRGDRHHVVAEMDGRVIGHGGAMLVLADVHITTVAVDETRRRRGVARALVVELLTVARARGATAATLEVRVSNDAAIGLYRRFGFAPAGTRRRYYPARGASGREDALVMWLTDLDGPVAGRRLAELDVPGGTT